MTPAPLLPPLLPPSGLHLLPAAMSIKAEEHCTGVSHKDTGRLKFYRKKRATARPEAEWLAVTQFMGYTKQRNAGGDRHSSSQTVQPVDEVEHIGNSHDPQDG